MSALLCAAATALLPVAMGAKAAKRHVEMVEMRHDSLSDFHAARKGGQDAPDNAYSRFKLIMLTADPRVQELVQGVFRRCATKYLTPGAQSALPLGIYPPARSGSLYGKGLQEEKLGTCESITVIRNVQMLQSCIFCRLTVVQHSYGSHRGGYHGGAAAN